MGKIFNVLLITLTLSIISCKKDSSSTCTPNMTATFNSDVFSACGSSAIFPSVGGIPATYLSISGVSRDESNSVKYSIDIKLNTSDITAITPRTYVVNNGSSVPSGQTFSVNVAARIAEGSGTFYNSTSGSLTIEQVSNTHIKGTFNANCAKSGIIGSGPATISITGGNFDYDIIN